MPNHDAKAGCDIVVTDALDPAERAALADGRTISARSDTTIFAVSLWLSAIPRRGESWEASTDAPSME
jgi:hypothetical protein